MNDLLELNNILCVGVVALSILAAYLLSKKSLQQKTYYKKIIDSSANIVVVHDTKHIVTANKTFFYYFKNYKNLADFRKDHICISDFFEVEDGYLRPPRGENSWLETLAESQNKKYKVKIKINDESLYFLISASLLDEKKNLYVMILSDITEQESTKHVLVSLSIKDKLTNIGNRKYYDDILHEHITLAQRYPHTFSLVLLDIDFFKKVNDSLGHDIGDQVLSEYTKFIGYHLREVDIFCRIGGEEFVLLLPHTSKDKAYILTQKLRSLVEQHKKIVEITMSFGVVEYEKGDDAQSIFKRADTALYRAKDTGRNKVIIG
ncbi:diguanylate cyclase/phosphodiesterase (GGDEF & EAL domains) with PAS/PAC sensor(s) [hydrothermal vent metagenome]|uniref:Diguanylate cyclase/phosphodiesterase (GGDEF & EAL domains) with PAS/PAC sensor(S) n=1 Tax=hydrothermal vent metagenome TaxID=652676 RepID=A0A1W1BCR6_9ZZZZ